MTDAEKTITLVLDDLQQVLAYLTKEHFRFLEKYAGNQILMSRSAKEQFYAKVAEREKLVGGALEQAKERIIQLKAKL